MNYEDKIFKKSDLEANDSISTYNGWAAQQNPLAFETFHNFLNEVKPKRILEIGTSLGGFTQFLNYTCKKLSLDCHILSYDIIEHSWYKDMIADGIDVRVENVFNYHYTEVKKEVVDFIQEDGVTVILCDGGNKIMEFDLLSNFMKENDFIMAHDYTQDKETFDKHVFKKLWNWHEISDKDIQEPCERNNLKSFKKEEFDKAVWVCKKKI